MEILRKSRLMRKYKKKGFKALSENEMLQIIFLFSGSYYGNYKELHLHHMINKSYDYLTLELGLKDKTACLIIILSEIIKISTKGELQLLEQNEENELIKIFKSKLKKNISETIYVIGMDDDFNFLGDTEITNYNEKQASICYKKLVYTLISWGATKVVFAHNHPTSSSKPSKGDIAVTRKVETILKKSQITLIDHYIFGKEHQMCSVKEHITKQWRDV